MRLSRSVLLEAVLCLVFAAAVVQEGLSASSSAYEEERTLLLAVKSGIDNWVDFSTDNSFQGWTSSPVCNWTGITCGNQGLVTEIKLGCYGCREQAIGSVVQELGNFTALQTIDFSNQFLTGPLPEAWSQQGYMSQLQSLNLSYNRLTGILPAWSDANAFPKLETLLLSNNEVSGQLPSPWGDGTAFSQLETLDLQQNYLTGQLPVEWGENNAWSALKELRLASNNLTSTIPDCWVETEGFPALEILDLSHNSLAGPVPTGFGEPPAALRYLDLSYNLFDGSLPGNWSDEGTANLTTLFLNNCNFSGPLPAAWGSPSAFQTLQVVDLHGNSLEGALPSTWGQHGSFPELVTLNLDDNWLSWQLQDSWGGASAFPSLQNLYLAYNALTRALPPAWGQEGAFPSLRTLDLSANYLTGTLPESWGSPGAFARLSNVSLVWNRFSGTIPASWANLSALNTLWVQPGNYQLCQGLPQGSHATLCKFSPTSGCASQSTLGTICSVSPPSAAQYLPPSTSTTTMQATLRLENSSTVIEAALTPALSTALLYVMTSAQAVQVVQYARTGTGNSSFEHQESRLTGRRLLTGRRILNPNAKPSFRRRTLQAPAPAPGTGYPHIMDAVMQITASPGRNVYNMEDQLETLLTSNALLSVLGASGVQLTGVQVLSVEPATMADLPSWWNHTAAFNATPLAPVKAITNATVAKPESAADHDSSTAVVAVISVACVVVVGLLIAAAVMFHVRRRRRWLAQQEKVPIGDLEQSDGSEDLKASSPELKRSAVSDCATAVAGSGRPQPASPAGSELPPSSSSTAADHVSAALTVLHRRSVSNDEQLGIIESGPLTSLNLPVMPWSDWEIDSGELQICRRPNGAEWELGCGSFGKVYKAIRGGSQPVAVKVLHDREEGPDFWQEIALLKACRHSNIVAFQGACVQNGRTMLVTEFMEGGDLFKALSHPSARKMLQWSCCGRNIALDIARGLHFLHARSVVHFDLKSHNILLSREGTAKITDVGLARIIKDGYISRLDSVMGTFAWAAPELLLGNRCTEKIDIYSFGVLLWELAVTSHTGERPQRGQMREVRTPEELPAEVEALRQDCMDSEPKLRPSAQDVYNILAASPK